MALNFPDNPQQNDTFTVNGRTYTYRGNRWRRTKPRLADVSPTLDVANDFTAGGALHVDSDTGRVGIGTANPQYELHVDGVGEVTGDFQVGQNLDVTGTVDVNGVRLTSNGSTISLSQVLSGTYSTQAATTNDDTLATTGFVQSAIANLVDSAPTTLNTLNELATALNDDPNFATTITNSIATKQDASTALTTSTTFGGNVSGTYNNIVIADDSHNHTIANVDNLQTTLDGKAASSHTHSYAATSHTHSYLPLSGGTLTGTLTYTLLNGPTGQTRDKIRVWSSSSYTIGMQSGYTYGHLGDYAMTFQMNNDSDRGFWWGDTSHSNAQGAMSLTTNGRLTVARSLSVGEGEGITGPSTTTLYVNGTAMVSGVIYAASGSGSGDALRVGNDSKLVDINAANTMGVYGLQNTDRGGIRLGSAGGTIYTTGSSTIIVSNRLNVNERIYSAQRYEGIYGVDGGVGPGRGPAAGLNTAGGNAFWTHWDGTMRLYIDATNVKNFVIDHPQNPDDQWLIHACSEGPTADVFYRGEAELSDGIAVIELPEYFEDLTELEGRTVMVTPIANPSGNVANLAAYEISNGRFVVEQVGGYNVPNQRFWWRVDAVRKNTSFPVQPNKSNVTIGGDGPYRYIKEMV